jgi:D-glycero-D-manno-heptose 1,7-bisphosphate phosphatase
MSRARAVFFDRDGTLMEEEHYCGDPGLVRVYAGVSEALARLKQAGFRVIVASNQSGIGRGLITEEQYRAVEREFLRQVGEGLIDASYFCPDPPGVVSRRRKPDTGMIAEAAADFELDLGGSFLIGDKASDIECGRRAGMKTIQVLTGYGKEQGADADFSAADVAAAVGIVLRVAGRNQASNSTSRPRNC